MAETMTSDPRESPEWAEYQRLVFALVESAIADEDDLPDKRGRYPEDLYDERRAALDTFVLRLLEQVAKLGARYADARAEADRLAVRPLMPEAE